MTRTCRHCGNQILCRKAKQFCSVACYQADRRQNRPPRAVCEQCGKRRPDDQPLCGLCTQRAGIAARIENVEWLLGQGESPWQVLIQLDTDVRRLSRFLRAHNRYDLAEAFYTIEAAARSAAA
jgi:predicted amidophosphoribosyltransferase